MRIHADVYASCYYEKTSAISNKAVLHYLFI